MQVYKCDACGKIIDDIYEEEMKVFFYGVKLNLMYPFAYKTDRTEKIQICDECFHNLKSIQQNKYHGGDNND